MSRSWKKHPWTGDNKGKKKKRFANSKVRSYLKNNENILKNSDYKKVYESWDICDYGWIHTWEEYWNFIIKRWYKWGYLYYPYPDKQKEYKYWYKTYKGK